MQTMTYYTASAARVLMALVFLLNGFGIIDQSIPAKELGEFGVPSSIVTVVMLGGRALEIVAGCALALGVYPRLAALGLFLFLLPATFVSHSFWLSAGTPLFQGQLINFFKNAGIWGGLLFIAASAQQPRLAPPDRANR
jgi:putative oxidoreductase